MKHLLKKTRGVLLNFEEMAIMLSRIKAVLNSRPITPLSQDPSDHEVLTPNHFLLGGPALIPPEPDFSSIPSNRLKIFKLVKAQSQLFWSKEYLPQLPKYRKWIKPCRNMDIGDLEILREENVPPMKWKLIRIVEVHHGADKVVRVVSVRTSTGATLKRPVLKLALLPITDDEDCADQLNKE